MLSATRSEGGCGTILAKGAAKPHSLMSLIPLWLSLLIGLTRADPGKSGRTIATPRKPGGACGPDSGALFHASIRPHEGSLSSSLIPAGRLGAAPSGGADGRETEL